MEIMIVILLIGVISSVVGYNMKGSLDKGKAFKSKQGAAKIQQILLFESIDKDIPLEKFITAAGKEAYIKHLINSGLFKDTKDCTDGWGEPYVISIEKGELIVDSPKLKDYEKSHTLKIDSKTTKSTPEATGG
ncbi:MAG: type II secretion system GspH family protein [Rhabdochlamydiaceae bacterium]